MHNNQILVPKKKFEYVFSLYQKGHLEKAINEIKQLNSQYPNQPILFNLIGACYKDLGELDGAAKMFEIAVSIKPDYAEAFFNLGVALHALDKKPHALECYKKALQSSPKYAEAHNNLGNLYKEFGLLDLSIESLEWAVAYKHDYAEAFNNLGAAYHDIGRVEDAIKSFERAIKINPNYTKAIFNLSLTQKDIGNRDLSMKLMEKALELNPMWSNVHLEISRLKKYEKNDPQITKVLSYLNIKDLSMDDRINFNFTLAKIFEDLGDLDKQFKHLNEANKLRKKESGYIFKKDIVLFNSIIETFKMAPKPLNIQKIKTKGALPFFILGMPRSGTSLVHQILSSHSLVYGAGELTKLYKYCFPHLKAHTSEVEMISETNLKSIREEYLGYIDSLKVSEKIIIDKMPLNFRFIGFILTAIPEAKVIHMKRDSMATCWSIYKYYFPGNSYSYNQKDIASYYQLYTNLMDFWHQMYPKKIYDLCYEDLTTNQEAETRKLLDYCELNWEESCLNFDKNKTAVKTTSSIQVKQKMYQGSSEVWKKYESYLQPLIKGLNYY